MPMTRYLNADRVCMLKGTTPEAVIGELVELLCRDQQHLDRQQVLNAVLIRERDVGTKINARLALPHARIPDVGEPLITVGLSRDGIVWGASAERSVKLVVLLVGDEKEPRALLAALGALAGTFQNEQVMSAILSADSPGALYQALLDCSTEQSADPYRQAAIEAVYSSACSLVERTGADSLLIMTERSSDLEFVSRHAAPCPTLLVTHLRRQLQEPDTPFEHVLEIPLQGMIPRHALDFALLLAISRNIIAIDSTIVCLYGCKELTRPDTIRIIKTGEDLRVPLSLRDELESGEIDFQVLLRVFKLATELAREGREGKPVGTLFVLGDFDQVRNQCHQMVINPFKGYGEQEKNVLDPSLAETVKEFAHIDGAFIIRGDGVIMSAGTFIRAEVMGDQLQGGLGARHTAGQAITACTKALSLVLSESTGTLTLYKNGTSVLSLKRGSA